MSVIVTVPRNAVKPFPLHQVYFSSLVKILVGLAKGKKKKTWPNSLGRILPVGMFCWIYPVLLII